MDERYHSRRTKDYISFDQWASEVRSGILEEESNWVTDSQLKTLYDQGMTVFFAWYEVQALYEQKDKKEPH